MGRNYYLCKGYYVDDYWNCELEKIFKDMKSLEQIDMYTARFNDFSEFRQYLIEYGLIDVTEGIVIANNKTDKETKEKRLVPIYQRTMIFKNDLNLLGIRGRSYKEIAKEVWHYVKERQNNEDFMKFILAEYIGKYESSKRKVKAPIYVNGDIFTLNRIINSKEKSSRDISEYEFSFANFFRNEIFKCEKIQTRMTFDGRDSESVTVFRPMGDEVNAKGLHDMLVHIIQYGGLYEYDYNAPYDGVDVFLKQANKPIEKVQCGEQIELDFDEHEEFLEDRDFERKLYKYANNRAQYDGQGNFIKFDPLDLNNPSEVEKDDNATSILMDQERLVKKRDGME